MEGAYYEYEFKRGREGVMRRKRWKGYVFMEGEEGEGEAVRMRMKRQRWRR